MFSCKLHSFHFIEKSLWHPQLSAVVTFSPMKSLVFLWRTLENKMEMNETLLMIIFFHSLNINIINRANKINTNKIKSNQIIYSYVQIRYNTIRLYYFESTADFKVPFSRKTTFCLLNSRIRPRPLCLKNQLIPYVIFFPFNYY